MKKLFMIHLGGKAKGALIEVHDLQFMIAEKIEDCEAALRDHWYGLDLKCHIDSYKVVENVKDYKISIVDQDIKQDLNLYFCHIGSYSEHLIEENHQFTLIVDRDIDSAKELLKLNAFNGQKQAHIDSIINVSESPLLNARENGYIYLEKSDENFDLKPDWQGYRRIDIQKD